jgi:predicted 3-demethylubiquinone-9 3-methyltransferase (glyoxalase superfamily)
VNQKITPFLWFDDNAEEAMHFYVSLFKDSEVLNVNRMGDAAGEEGKALTVSFRIAGQEFMGLNGGPHFKLTEAFSLFVDCDSQAEVDELWEKLSEGGATSQCGWLTDKYGLTWQIIPTVLMEMLSDEDRARADRVMQAMLQMTKIDIAALQRAYAQD